MLGKDRNPAGYVRGNMKVRDYFWQKPNSWSQPYRVRKESQVGRDTLKCSQFRYPAHRCNYDQECCFPGKQSNITSGHRFKGTSHQSTENQRQVPCRWWWTYTWIKVSQATQKPFCRRMREDSFIVNQRMMSRDCRGWRNSLSLMEE